MVKLSTSETIILANLSTQYKWIARDKMDGELRIFEVRPFNNGQYWETRTANRSATLPYKSLFKFIKGTDEGAYKIDKLLDDSVGFGRPMKTN